MRREEQRISMNASEVFNDQAFKFEFRWKLVSVQIKLDITILRFNLSHFSVQPQPFYTMKWATLHAKMTDIETQSVSR